MPSRMSARHLSRGRFQIRASAARGASRPRPRPAGWRRARAESLFGEPGPHAACAKLPRGLLSGFPEGGVGKRKGHPVRGPPGFAGWNRVCVLLSAPGVSGGGGGTEERGLPAPTHQKGGGCFCKPAVNARSFSLRPHPRSADTECGMVLASGQTVLRLVYCTSRLKRPGRTALLPEVSPVLHTGNPLIQDRILTNLGRWDRP